MPAIRRAVAEIDPTLPIYDVQLLDERVADAVARPRFTATATAIFAICRRAARGDGRLRRDGVSVSVRREELALRLALGETPRGLQLGVLLHAAKLAAAGARRRPRRRRSGCCDRWAARSTASRRRIRACWRSRSLSMGAVALRRRRRARLARERHRSDDRASPIVGHGLHKNLGASATYSRSMAQPIRRRTKRYGWIPDLPDQRDRIFTATPATLRALPPRVDLRAQNPPIYDQGQLGSCTAQAIAAALQFAQAKQRQADVVHAVAPVHLLQRARGPRHHRRRLGRDAARRHQERGQAGRPARDRCGRT